MAIRSRVHGAGKATGHGHDQARQIAIAYALRKTVTAKHAGTAKLTLVPGKPAKAALTKLKKARVSISVSFAPAGGTAAKRTASATVTGSLKRK